MRVLLLLPLLLPATAAAQGIYVLDRSSSQVVFRADAMANRLVGRSQHLRGTVRLSGFDLRRMYGIVSFPIASLRMDSPAQERELTKLLGAPENRDVVFEIDSISSDSGAAPALTFHGRLTLRGITRPVRFAGAADVAGARVHASGSATVDVREWGITPPRRFFGLIRMSPHVRLSFRADFTRHEERSSRDLAARDAGLCTASAQSC